MRAITLFSVNCLFSFFITLNAASIAEHLEDADARDLERGESASHALRTPVSASAGEPKATLEGGEGSVTVVSDVGDAKDEGGEVVIQVAPVSGHVAHSRAASVVDTDTREGVAGLDEGTFVGPDYESVAADPNFDVSRYFDQEDYIRKKVAELVNLEAIYDSRAIIYSRSGTVCMWGAGLALGSIGFLSSLGAADIIDPHMGNLYATLLAVGAGLGAWAGNQLSKISHRYDLTSRRIQSSLGLPPSLNPKQVDTSIELPRGAVSGGGGDASSLRPKAVARPAH